MKHSKFIALVIYYICIQLFDLSSPYFLNEPLPKFNGFDVYKFVFWLIIPLFFLLKQLKYSSSDLLKYTIKDLLLLVAIFIIGLISMALIPHVPSLKSYYLSGNHMSSIEKFEFFQFYFTWVVSWVIGWEFLHRFALLKNIPNAYRKYTVIGIAVIETLYHYNKPPLEIIGVFFFSIILTKWAIKTKNFLLPLAAHFIIELELILFQILYN